MKNFLQGTIFFFVIATIIIGLITLVALALDANNFAGFVLAALIVSMAFGLLVEL